MIVPDAHLRSPLLFTAYYQSWQPSPATHAWANKLQAWPRMQEVDAEPIATLHHAFDHTDLQQWAPTRRRESSQEDITINDADAESALTLIAMMRSTIKSIDEEESSKQPAQCSSMDSGESGEEVGEEEEEEDEEEADMLEVINPTRWPRAITDGVTKGGRHARGASNLKRRLNEEARIRHFGCARAAGGRASASTNHTRAATPPSPRLSIPVAHTHTHTPVLCCWGGTGGGQSR